LALEQRTFCLESILIFPNKEHIQESLYEKIRRNQHSGSVVHAVGGVQRIDRQHSQPGG
jgi:hypothetical protein